MRHAKGVLLLAVWAAFGCSAETRPGTLEIIDAHVHTTFTGTAEPASGILRTREAFLQAMQEAGVVGAVSLTDSAGNGYDTELVSHGVIFCGGIGSRVDVARLEQGLADGRYRCLKIYLGYAYHYASDSVYEPAYRLARQYDVPVVFHTGDTWSTKGKLKYAHPMAIDEVAVDHPNVTFVIAHAGYPWVRTAAEIAYKNPNVYVEASAFMVGDARERPDAWVDQYVVGPINWLFGYVEDPRKVLFGSDWPLVNMAGYVAAYKRAIPPEHWRAVFHDNAVRVFHLDRTPPG